METTSEGCFDDLERFLANLEVPEVFANLWTQFQNAVPDIRSEATVHFYPKMESASSLSYRFTWAGRHVFWSKRGIEHYGFAETVEQLKTVPKARAHSIQTIVSNMDEATLAGMGAPYSEDLRKRVLGALDGGMNKMQVHRTFNVARSTIDDWLKLREATGSVAVVPAVRRSPAPALGDLVVFEAFATRHCHKTLAQMATAWCQETGRQLSHNTFALAMKKIGWTRKKSAGSTQSVWGPAQP